MKNLKYVYVVRNKKTNEISKSFGSKLVFVLISHILLSIKQSIKLWGYKESNFKDYVIEKYVLKLVECKNMNELIKEKLLDEKGDLI